MARTNNLSDFLTDVADSIRIKTGKTGKISAASFDTEIEGITAGGEINLQNKSVNITENGTQTIKADDGYDGLNEVEVITNVASGGGDSGNDEETAVDFSSLSKENVSVKKDGSTGSWDFWYLYNPIDISGVTKIKYTNASCYKDSSLYLYGVVFYDENSQFLLGIGVDEADTVVQVTADGKVGYDFAISGETLPPTNAKYMRIGYASHFDASYFPQVILVSGVNSGEGGEGNDSNAAVTILEWVDKYPTKATVGKDCTGLEQYFYTQLNTSSSPYSSYGLFRNLEEVVLLPTVTDIGERFVQNATRLKKINLDNIQRIWESAFKNCNHLESVELPEGLNSQSEGIFTSNLNTLLIETFYNCSALTSIRVPSNITRIGYNCFYNNTSLKTIEMPETLTEIGGGYMSSGGTSYSGSVFGGCTSLELEELPDSLTKVFGNSNFAGCANITLSSLPSGLTQLDGQYTFDGCGKITISELPDGVTTLGTYAFRNCVSIPKFNTNNVTIIPYWAFVGCTGMSGLIIPKATTIRGNNSSNGAFYNCTGLKAVWIGNAITSANFQRYAFYKCTALTKMFIDLPRATVEAFTNYQYAFMNDTSKTGIIICNDDAGFMTKEAFEAIDWVTYSE